MDCCVHGASRWAVKERRRGGVRALGEWRLECVIFAFSFSQLWPQGQQFNDGVAWERTLGKELTKKLVPAAQGCSLA